MPSTINADNGVVSGSSGVKTTADTSGVLALQSNGTTGLTLGTDLSVTVVGAGSIQGLTVGRGAGAVATNTAVGASALATNSSGDQNTALGYQALNLNSTGGNSTGIGYLALSASTAGSNSALGARSLQQNTSGASNSSFGAVALYSNLTGSFNSAFGADALRNTTASYGTAVGYQAGFSSVSADYNTFIGYYAGRSTTGDQNTFLGKFAGNAITSGATNTIVGAYNGNQASLDIRTASNYTVISDGGGTPHLAAYAGGTVALQGAIPNAGTGITFPATQSASSNANTLDDYEEGTWTPSIGGTATYTVQAGYYTKIGNFVKIRFHLNVLLAGTGSATTISGIPFNPAASDPGIMGGVVTYINNLATPCLAIGVYAQGSSIFFMTRNSSSTTNTTQGPAVMANNFDVYAEISYMV